MAKAKPAAPVSHLQIFDCEQGSDEWYQLHLGIPTASHFSVLMAEGTDGGPSMTRTQYLHRLAGEQITGMIAEETFKSKAMMRGKEMEPQAIAAYVEHTGEQIRRVGFVKNFTGLKHCGASPDALVGFNGGLETKTIRPDLMIPLLLKGARMIPAHKAQVQGNIWVCERDWWDLSLFYPRMPKFIVKCDRDEKYVRDLSDAVERFNHDLKTLVEQLRRMS